MKKTLIAFAALSAIAGIAQAQSTVTLYGLLDANLNGIKTNTTNSTTTATRVDSVRQTKIDSGALNGTRFGFRVSEDLGGGLAAIGNLEAGVNLDTGTSGQGGVLFGRRANVGLSGGFGTVTIGRNSSSYDDVGSDYAMMGQTIFDPSGVNNGNSAANAERVVNALNSFTPGTALTAVRTSNGTTVDNALNQAVGFMNRNTSWVGYNTRFNNSIKYISPNFSGFSGSVMYGFGEDKTTAQNASSVVSANVKYANGPLLVSGGYQSENMAVTAANGAKPALVNTLFSVAYDLGVAKIGFGANRAQYKDLTIAAGGVSPAGVRSVAAQREYSFSVAVPLGAATISAGYAQSKGDDLGKSTGVGIQALYSLSKRTTLYTGYSSTKAYDNLAAAVTASLAGSGSSIGKTNTLAAGIRHTF